MDHHKETVAVIAANVRQFYDHKEAFHIYHGSTSSTRKITFHRDKLVDTSNLSHILQIDSTLKTALVEPNVPMDQLVEATLKHGLVPPVVMEFPSITVGGGFAGSAGESSSFKHGIFNSTIDWIEIILANGEIVTASETDKQDLFDGASGSFGTLGVITLLKLRLIPAKTYVQLTYHPVTSVPAAIQLMEHMMTDESIDYIDCIFFSPDSGTVMAGHLTNALSPDCIGTQRFTRPYDPWFYLHASSITRSSPTRPVAEAIPLTDYLFRYDRGAFWGGTYAFKYFITPFNRITRWALDYFMHTKVIYRALHASGLAKQYIVQDLALPASTVQEFIEFVDNTFGIWPLLLCPLRQGHSVPMHPRSYLVGRDGRTTQSGFDVGVWGPGPKDHLAFVKANRALERKVQDLGGAKMLYAHAYYTEDEFWEIYDRGWYDALRAKYEATFLPSVWEKVRVKWDEGDENGGWGRWVKGIWPLRGLWGVLNSIRGNDYLVAK